MKLLLDQNVSRKLLTLLESRFPGSAHVLPLDLATKTDSEIWYYARLHGYTLVTKNTDMVDLCLLRGAPPKIVWLRVGNCPSAVVRDVLADNADQITAFEANDNVVLSLFRFRVA